MNILVESLLYSLEEAWNRSIPLGKEEFDDFIQELSDLVDFEEGCK